MELKRWQKKYFDLAVHSVYIGLVVGFFTSLFYFIYFVKINHYLPYNLKNAYLYLSHYLYFQHVLYISVAFFVIFLSISIWKKLNKFYLIGFIFGVIGLPLIYYLNVKLLPSFYSMVSITINVVVTLILLLIIYFLAKSIKFDVLKIQKLFSYKVLVPLIVLATMFQLYYFTAKDLHFINLHKKDNSKRLVSLFNLNLPQLQDVKKLAEDGQYEAAQSELLNYYKRKQFDNFGFDLQSINAMDLDTLLKGAQEIINHKFTNLNKSYYLGDKINWDRNPDSDPDWIWKLNRHANLLRLGWAYLRTNNEKYAIEFNNLITSWMEANPPQRWKNEKSRTWRLLEVGERMYVSWIPLYEMFNQSPNFTTDARVKMLLSFYNHAQFLKSFKSPLKNHLLMETRGLLTVCAYFPEFKLSKEWEKIAFERINHAFQTEINRDGSYYELATGYHWLALRQYEAFYDLAQKLTISNKWQQKIKLMYRFLMNLMNPDGSVPQINDGITPENFPHKLTRAAKKFNDANFLYVGTGGREGRLPAYTSCQLNDAGYYVMRTDWGKKGSVLIFDGGPYGSSHGHEDKLSFECSVFGTKVLIDAGFYGSNENDPFLEYFHRTAGHNAVMVDGKSQTRYWHRDTWVYSPKYKNENQWISTNNFDYVQGQYLNGYGDVKERIDRSAKHFRAILFVKPNYWIVSDWMISKKNHEYEQLFHFMPMPVKLKDDLSITTLNGDSANLVIQPILKEGLQARLYKGSLEPIQGWVSFAYNQKTPAPCVIYRKRGNNVAFHSLLLPVQVGKRVATTLADTITVKRNGKEISTSDDLVCVRIRFPKYTDLILLSLTNNTSVQFSDFETDGKVAYLRLDSNEKIIKSFQIGGSFVRRRGRK